MPREKEKKSSLKYFHIFFSVFHSDLNLSIFPHKKILCVHFYFSRGSVLNVIAF